MGRYDILFEPVRIGPVTAPNRFFSVPHATGHSPLMPNGSIGMRAMKAEGGWGVVSMQLVEIDPTSNISNLPMETLWDEQDVRSQARLVEKVKEHGALTACELAHTGLRSRNITTGVPILGPSALPNLKPEFPAHSKAMDLADIRAFRDSHKAAAKRALEAGYDIVYVYAAHDASLLWHFLSPLYNFRTDAYGGSFRNRLRLFREVLEDTLEVVAGKAAVAVRFPVHDFKAGSPLTYDNEGRGVVEELAELPDLWDVNVAGWPRDSGTSRFDEEGFQTRYTSFVKQVTSKPVVGVGRFTSADAMVSQVQKGLLDLVGAARPSIADPFLPQKIRGGDVDDIRECIGCNICVASDAYSVPLRCTQNPTISEEWRRGWHPERATKCARAEGLTSVLIVGSGPAGLECAEVLSRAGVHVTVAEGKDRLGGRVLAESGLPGLSAWQRVVDHRLYRLRQRPNVELFTNSPMSVEATADLGVDHVVWATGSTWRRDGVGSTSQTAIPGFADHALTPDDLFTPQGHAGSVAIYDDDHYYMGNVLALQAAAQGRPVTLVCPLPTVASWMAYTLEQPRVLAELYEAGVTMVPNAVAQSYDGRILELQHAESGKPMPSLVVSSLICVAGRAPVMPKFSSPDQSMPAGHSVIGDAQAPNTIQAAVFAGHLKARELLSGGVLPAFRRETPTLMI